MDRSQTLKFFGRISAAVIIAAGLTCAIPQAGSAQTASQSRAMQYQNPTFDQGVRAFNAGDYEMALRSFLKLAHRGDPQSQYYLAYMYDVGHGLTSDPNEAARWYLRSAEQNYMPAVVYAGYIYATGHGVSKDMDKAKGWYERAAASGDIIAQNNLGSLLLAENTRDSQYKAAQWFMSAAIKGSPSAQYNLANMYREGTGIRRNLEEASKWYLRAALQGDKYAQNALGYMYLNGYGVEKSLSRGIQWLRRAAEQNLIPAQLQLANIYDRQSKRSNIDDGLRQEYETTAAVWYANAAREGNSKAAFQLAEYYRQGTGVPQNITEAVRLLNKLVDIGYEPAKLKLAQYLETGEGGLRADPAKALQWYEQAADEGDADAMFEAGRMHYDGIGTQRDLIEAFKWFALTVENLPEESPKREDAIIARVEVSNAMSARDLETARGRVSSWRPR
tara:strand:+ start:290 stop:1630 length:1341 start_codon:yes stop_codon:yes gene_type:complete